MKPSELLRDDANKWKISFDLRHYEENAYLWRMMKLVGHPDTELCLLDGYNHGQMPEGAFPLLLRFAQRILSRQ